MSYKSYAQAGQYGTYHIDLPIKAEINEDLRVAGDFAEQMERSQQYREKWAGSYLSALNSKSGIERQNRDDNFEFLQKNFKAIYEGEQREFEGRLAELQREQAEAANADPGFFDDLLPSLIKLAPKIMGMVAAGQAAHQAGQQQLATDVITKTGITPAQLGAQQRFQALPEGVISSSEKAQVFEAFHRNHASNVSAEDLQTVLRMTGENQMHSQLVAWRNDIPRVTGRLNSISMAGSGERFDPSLPMWRGPEGQAKYIQEFQKHTQEVVNDSWSLNSREAYSDTVNFGIVQKSVTSIQNGIFNKAYNVWGTQAKGLNDQHIANQLHASHSLGKELEHFNSRVEHFSKDPNLTPQEARLEAINEFSANWLKGSGTHPQYVAFRQALDAQKAATFNKKNGTKGQHIPRGGPVDDALDRMGIAIQNRDNQIQGVHNRTLQNQQKKDAEKFWKEYGNILDTEGRVAATNFLNQALTKDWSDDPKFQKELNGMASHPAVSQPYVKPTFAQQSGIKPADLDRAATDVAIGGLPTTAANNALGDAKLAKLNGNRIAISKIKGHMQANWSAYVRKYAGVYAPGSEELLEQAAFDSYKAMKDGGALPIRNENGKDPAAVSDYNFQVGTINITNRTADYNRLTKLKPKEYHSLYPTDKKTFEDYGKAVQKVIQMGGDINAPDQFQARVNLHNMPAVIERAETLDITKDEALDQILDNLGYPDAIQDPFTEADRNTNSEILNRLHNNHKLTTNQGEQAKIAVRDNQLQPASHVTPVSYTPNNVLTSMGPSVIPSNYVFGKYGSKIPYSGDTDGQETGTDFRLPAGQGAPIRFPFPVTVMRTGTTGHPAYGLQGTSGRLGASGHGFGFHEAVKVRLLNGNEVELVIGHLDGMSPLANIPPGTVIPPGTIIGYQGATGRSLTHGGGPYDHLTIHTNGLNGYTSTPDDLMHIVHSLYFASVGGNR